MKYILGFGCLIIAGFYYFKPELLTTNTNIIFGCVFICLANLFFNSKRNNEK